MACQIPSSQAKDPPSLVSSVRVCISRGKTRYYSYEQRNCVYFTGMRQTTLDVSTQLASLHRSFPAFDFTGGTITEGFLFETSRLITERRKQCGGRSMMRMMLRWKALIACQHLQLPIAFCVWAAELILPCKCGRAVLWPQQSMQQLSINDLTLLELEFSESTLWAGVDKLAVLCLSITDFSFFFSSE